MLQICCLEIFPSMTERGKINEQINRLPTMSEEELDNFVKEYTVFYGDYIREIFIFTE